MKVYKYTRILLLGLAVLILILTNACEFPSKVISEEDENNIEFKADVKFILIPAGPFTYGLSAKPVNIDYDFEIMKYPVTAKNYTVFLNEQLNNDKIIIENNMVMGFFSGNQHWPAGYYKYLDLDDPDCQIGFHGLSFSWRKKDGKSLKHHPVVEVTWFGSNAFAQHYGFRLPNVIEWEKAARGSTGYTYPWGNWIDKNRANFWDSGDDYDNGTTPVSYFNGNLGPDSPSVYGVYDMAGNVWEWMSRGERHLAGYSLRGGSWASKSQFPSAGGEYNLDLTVWLSRKGSFSPITSTGDIGFRCVRDLSDN